MYFQLGIFTLGKRNTRFLVLIATLEGWIGDQQEPGGIPPSAAHPEGFEFRRSAGRPCQFSAAASDPHGCSGHIPLSGL